MKQQAQWSRRAFVRGAGYLSAGSVVAAAAPTPGVAAHEQNAPGFGFVGSATGGGSLHVFAIDGQHWRIQQRISSKAPVSLAVHPKGRFLYVVNQVQETGNLPRGSVEAYEINTSDGRLALINRQPLALSAVMPRMLAITSDGRSIVVAVHGGGAYNVLPIKHDGTLGSVQSRFKETGSGPHPQLQTSSHPHTVIVTAEGKTIIASDEGSDRLSVFAIQNDHLVRQQQIQVASGSGPGHLALHESGSNLFVVNSFQNSISSYKLNASGDIVERPVCSVDAELSNTNEALICISDILYAAGSSAINSWKIDPITGQLSHLQSLACPPIRRLTKTLRGKNLIGVDLANKRLVQIDIVGADFDRQFGRMSHCRPIASVDSPISVATKLS